MIAFWKRNKKESKNEDEEYNQSTIDHEETIRYKRPAVHTRMSRHEYRKLQQESNPKKTFADYRLTAKEKAVHIATTYILPLLIIYIAYIGYHFLADKLLVRLAENSLFWVLHIIYIGVFITVMYIALFRMFGRFPKITRHFGGVAWLGAVYFYITFLLTHTSSNGPVLSAALLFVSGVVQLSGLGRRIRGGFIVVAAVYGNYLTALDFPNVWLVLGVGGLFVWNWRVAFYNHEDHSTNKKEITDE